MELLNAPDNGTFFALQLMGDAHEATGSFWEELEQRLHNQLSISVSHVEHMRRLLDYYATDFPAISAEYGSRNAGISEMNETAFLRDLRNYLLHYGAPPIVQTFELGQASSCERSSQIGPWCSMHYKRVKETGTVDLRVRCAIAARTLKGPGTTRRFALP
jgi:hypothetical protein